MALSVNRACSRPTDQDSTHGWRLYTANLFNRSRDTLEQ
jgi:hypothetical protein